MSNVEGYSTYRQHCNCHLQGECVLVACFWKPYMEQVVGGEWDMKDLIGKRLGKQILKTDRNRR
jgi:hypothetical protein